MSQEQLLEAYKLIKAGQRMQAETVLRPLVEADEDSADAWWLLANAVADADDKRSALNHVLRLRPDHPKARLMLERLNERFPPLEAADEPESDFDRLFDDDYDAERPPRIVVTKPGGKNNNALLIILAIIGGVTVLGCAACFLIAGGAAVVVEQAMSDPEISSLMDELTSDLRYGSVPDDAIAKGVIEPGQTRRDAVGTFDDHTYTFSGASGAEIFISVEALDSTLDPVLYLYGPDGMLIDRNDDYDDSTHNARLELRLPRSGTYTILVTPFGDGGRYALELRYGSAV
jgi:hypothetical protein